jgi:regulatory protein
MKLTNITQQQKNRDRYSLFVDGQYAFSLGASALLDAKLVVGQELSDAELRDYKQLSADDKAYGLALAYVARRMRSEGELQDYFRRKGYAPALAEDIMGRLQVAGFVDDAEFARRWVENRRQLKSSSAKRLRLELRQKKISPEIVEEVLSEDATDERVLLRELVTKKRKQSRYQDDQKLLAYLARQGFAYDDIKAALAGTVD